jgi:hypothetical protein
MGSEANGKAGGIGSAKIFVMAAAGRTFGAEKSRAVERSARAQTAASSAPLSAVITEKSSLDLLFWASVAGCMTVSTLFDSSLKARSRIEGFYKRTRDLSSLRLSRGEERVV